MFFISSHPSKAGSGPRNIAVGPTRTARFSQLFLAAIIAIGFMSMLAPGRALALCVQNGTTETCTGDLPGALNFNTSSGINDLEISNVTTGPSQVSLQGVGATQTGSGSSGTAAYTCDITNTGSNPSGASCSINNSVQPPTCTATNGSNQTASCVASQTGLSGTGPSGNSGPPVTVHVVAPTSGPVTIGGASAIGPPVAVFGISTGSQGGDGGSATLIGDGGNGGAGVDGGKVTVTFTGQLSSGSQGGLLAQSVGGNGGNGGSGGSIGGSGGSGGAGGFGNTATANFDGGSINITGTNEVGVTAISQGGNGGSGAGGGFFFWQRRRQCCRPGRGGPGQYGRWHDDFHHRG